MTPPKTLSTQPACPACRSDGPHITDARGVTQCGNCRWLFTVGTDGTRRDLFSIARAGRFSRRG